MPPAPGWAAGKTPATRQQASWQQLAGGAVGAADAGNSSRWATRLPFEFGYEALRAVATLIPHTKPQLKVTLAFIIALTLFPILILNP